MSGARANQPRLLNPTSTAAVILGAHDWTEAGLGPAVSFLRSARSIVDYLLDPAGLGLDRELVIDLFDDTAGASDQLVRVRDTLDQRMRERHEAGRPVVDVIVYYIGHGQVDDAGHLSMLVRRSRQGMETETGIRALDLASTLRRAAPHQRRSVILDCCFSEAAARDFISQSGPLDQAVAAIALKDLRADQPARGTLLLCSSPAGEVSMGPPNAERTLFSGAVLKVLGQGVEGSSSYLSFADLRDAAFAHMLLSFGVNAPRPVLHQVNAAHGDLTLVPAFPNRASAAVGPRAPRPEPPPLSAAAPRHKPNRSKPKQPPPSVDRARVKAGEKMGDGWRPAKVNFDDTLLNWQLWGQLAELWICGLRPLPKDVKGLVAQAATQGISNISVPGSPDRNVVFYWYQDIKELSLMLPSEDLLTTARKSVMPGPYPLPVFYDQAYTGPRNYITADQDTVFATWRVGEFVINHLPHSLFDDTLLNWRLWGQLVELWIYGLRPLPKDVKGLVAQATAHGISNVSVPDSLKDLVVYSWDDEKELAFMMPSEDILRTARKNSRPYPLPAFYDEAYTGPRNQLITDQDMIFSNCRVGE